MANLCDYRDKQNMCNGLIQEATLCQYCLDRDIKDPSSINYMRETQSYFCVFHRSKHMQEFHK